MEGYRYVVACIDFSEASPDVLLRAALVAKASAARLAALHVVEHFPEDIPSDEVLAEIEDPATAFTARARQRLGELVQRAGTPAVELEVVLSRRSATQGLLTFTGANPVDLLVLGGPHGGALAALGSTAGGIVNKAACDVLVVRGDQ